MDEKLTHLVETAIKIKEAYSNNEIRIMIAEDYLRAIVTTPAVNDLGGLYQMADGLEMRLEPVDNEIEIRLYVE